MMQETDLFYLQLAEPNKGALLSLRQHMLAFDKDITEVWKFNMPFFTYKGNRFCYFRLDRKSGMPYLGFNDGKWIDHPGLVFEDRSRIKVYRIDPARPLPFETINEILNKAIALYK